MPAPAHRGDVGPHGGHLRPARSSRCRPRRSRASSCARGATRTPSTGTCASTARCARSSSAPTTSCPRRSGGILLDDPRAKLAGAPAPRLTFIAAFGPGVESVVGKRLPSDRGFAGRVYRTGRPQQTDQLEPDDPLLDAAPEMGSLRVAGRRADRRRRVDLRHPAARQPALGRALHAARQGAPAHLRGVHVVVDPERARRHPRARPGARRRSDRPRQQPLLPHPPRRRDRPRRSRRHRARRCSSSISTASRGSTTATATWPGAGPCRRWRSLLADNAPAAALVARYGGDEFVVILPGANLARAAQTAEALRAAIAERDLLRSPAGEPAHAAAPASAAHHGVDRRRLLPRPPGARRHAAPAREHACCAWPTRRCTGPRPTAATAFEIADPED